MHYYHTGPDMYSAPIVTPTRRRYVKSFRVIDTTGMLNCARVCARVCARRYLYDYIKLALFCQAVVKFHTVGVPRQGMLIYMLY